jgi:hypothetical protein
VGATTNGGAIYSQKTAGTAFNVTNCILWGNATNKEIGGATGYKVPVVSYTDIDQTVHDGSNVNINTDPLFVDALTADYRLQGISPCISAATSVGAPADDLVGTLRPQGVAFDMGAFEYILDPTAITLSSFNAKPGNGSVTLNWITETEIDNAGFNIYRAGADGVFVKINDELIPAQGNAASGADYQFVDSTVQNRQTYTYKLEDVDLSGAATMHGPVQATPRFIYLFQ